MFAGLQKGDVDKGGLETIVGLLKAWRPSLLAPSRALKLPASAALSVPEEALAGIEHHALARP